MKNLLIVLCLIVASTSYADAIKIKEVKFSKVEKSDVLRFGDVNNDNNLDHLIVQSYARQISYFAMHDHRNKLLWSIGKASSKNHKIAYDLPVQVFDINGDNKAEVIILYKKFLQIRNGQTGKVIKEIRIKSRTDKRPSEIARWDIRTNDSIFIGKLFSKTRYSILIKDRYSHFYTFSDQLRLQHKSDFFSTGHYPTSHDIDNDGIDELFIGYRLYKKKKILFDLSDQLLSLGYKNLYQYHNDGVFVDVSQNKVTYATSKYGITTDLLGNITTVVDMGHSQCAVSGKFHSHSDEHINAFVDKDSYDLIFSDNLGNRINTISNLGDINIQAVYSWGDTINYVLVNKLSTGGAALLNSSGEFVEIFTRNSVDSFTRSYHFNLIGDHHSEVIVSDIHGFSVYANSDYDYTKKTKIESQLFTFYTGER